MKGGKGIWKERVFTMAAILILAGTGMTWLGNITVPGMQTLREPENSARKAVGEALVQDSPESQTFLAMDTVISMEIYGDHKEEAVKKSVDQINSLEALWSVTREGSQVYELNHHQGSPVKVSKETAELISFALEMERETEGALNPALYPIVKAWGFTTREYQIPDKQKLQRLLEHTDFQKLQIEEGTVTLPEQMEIDFGAIAKGYTGDLVVETMKKYGITSGIVNLGGNVALIGNAPDGKPWRTGIRSPYGEGTIGVLEAGDCHIITSGGYERYFTGEDGTVYWHILNPETGCPADSGIISATIVGTEGKRCDALSTAVFVMGLEKAEAYWRTHEGIEMILVTEDNQIYLTEGLDGRFALNEMSQGIPVHVIKK
jgi:Membrane-associated lipoprotein involved in thiamine biosynthesis